MEYKWTLSGEQEAGHLLALQKRCQDMLDELVAQVKMYLPKNRSLFDSLCKLSPANILMLIKRPAFTDLPFSYLMECSLKACEEQYHQILYHPWNNEEIFAGGIPDDPVQFWSAVKNIRKNTENFIRTLLATFWHIWQQLVMQTWRVFFPTYMPYRQIYATGWNWNSFKQFCKYVPLSSC